MAEKRNLSLADLQAMGFDIKNLRRVKRDAKEKFAEDPLERDACTVPLISARSAHVTAESFGLPFSNTQENSDEQNSAMAVMFVRMNSEAYLAQAEFAATSELETYRPSSKNSGFLEQLNKWANDRNNFPDPLMSLSAIVGSSIMLRMIRTQLGYQFVEKINRSHSGYDVPEGVISGKEWLTAFGSVFPFTVDRTNPIDRMNLPKIPREQIAVHEVLERARLIAPSPSSLIDGANGVYHVLDKNWGKLKIR